MIETLRQIIERAWGHLAFSLTTYAPPLLAGLIILLGAWIAAVLARWLLARIFKGIAVDRFLYRSGLGSMFDPRGRLRASRVAGAAVYWLILICGFLTALNAFNTQLTNRIVEGTVLLLPKLLTAAAIVLGGLWLAQYLSRSALVWSSNEELPRPRRIAAAVRVAVVFVAVVAAADYLDFARGVFLAAFIILGAGTALAGGIAVGLGVRDAVSRSFTHDQEPAQTTERSLWNHL